MNNSTNFVIDSEVVAYVKNANRKQLNALIIAGDENLKTSALFGCCMNGGD